MNQGDLFWITFDPPSGSGPGYRHPHVIIQNNVFRARERITSHFRIQSSVHLELILTRKILNVGFATPAGLLPQVGSI